MSEYRDAELNARGGVAEQHYLMCRGAVLQQWRRAAGLTQEELAELVSLSREYISKIERGIRESAHDLIERNVRALGHEMWELELETERQRKGQERLSSQRIAMLDTLPRIRALKANLREKYGEFDLGKDLVALRQKRSEQLD